MFAVSATRTMAGAKRLVVDTGINLRRAEPKAEVVDLAAIRREKAEAERKRILAERARKQMESRRVESERRLDTLFAEPQSSSPREVIWRVLAWHPGIVMADVLGPSRTRSTVAARHDCMAAVYDNCLIQGARRSLPNMGRIFKRDHTTLIHALRKRGARPGQQGETR